MREVNERAKKRLLVKPSAEIPLEENFLEGCENEFRLCAQEWNQRIKNEQILESIAKIDNKNIRELMEMGFRKRLAYFEA